MTEPVSYERRGNVALITIDNPPVNALAQPVRAGLLQAVVAADDDPEISVIVLHGAGKNFIAGADIRELDMPPREPLLNDVLLRIEACRKPVVAALHGMALGGGFETALACHYRCATHDVQLGLPEIKLALLPGAGGTQRLPRAVGVKVALDLMITGEPIGFERAQELGLIDRAIENREAAVGFALDLAAAQAQPRRLKERAIPDASIADAEFFAAYRQSLPRSARGSEAAERIIQCVEAAVRSPFDEALALSRKLFEQCRASSQSAALRHLFFAERAARGPAGRSSGRPIENVCIVGAGTMGSGIAVSCALGGLNVTLIDAEPKALEAGVTRVHSAIEGAVRKGRLSSVAGEAAKARVKSSDALTAAGNADLVIEAVFESMPIKQKVFGELDEICRPGTVLATNTSTLDIDTIANSTRRPADVLGMHFFSPAHVMKLVEIVRGSVTSDEVVATALAVAKRIGKLGVVVGNCFGFVGNRMLYAYGQQNQLMMLEGASPERIDSVLEEWGMAMGPNAVGDLAGLDVGYRVRRERKSLPNDPCYFRVSDMLAEMGRYGQKSGRGFYRYDAATRARVPDPEVTELIRAEARRLGVAQRAISDREIIERCIGALVDEGSRILEEGIASSADDIDVIWCNGYGFPRTRGGPMFYGRATACN